MHIVMLTPEISPAAKVGGLADMVVGLSRELMKNGHTVEVVVPMHKCLRWDRVQDAKDAWSELWVPQWGQWNKEKVVEGTVAGVRTFFVSCGLYSARDKVYGYDDDIYRFAYFCRAALEFLHKSGRRPDILHAHDWTTALAPVLVCEMYARLGWEKTRSVFTIHNTECQGLCWYGDKVLSMIGLDPGALWRPDRLRDDHHANCVNLMRGAIVYSNFISTVSPSYAGEIRTPAGGHGLHNVLNLFAPKLGGILNGIDPDEWNPAADPKIPQAYDATRLVEKYKNKYALRERLNLADVWKPIVSVVTRLTHQKGLDLIKHAIRATLRMQGQFVLLGESPDGKVNGEFWRIKTELEKCPDVHLWIGYSEELAHLIYAGSDLFLVPSNFEPCGLTQMIAMRYGTVPVVRRTGGLGDSVADADHAGRGPEGGTGFVFDEPTPAGFDGALHRAIRRWYEAPEVFQKIILNGMNTDWSWKNPARDYENVYRHIQAR